MIHRLSMLLCLAQLALCGAAAAQPAAVDVPEPMVYDMVRGLGPTQGELEANVLAELSLQADPELVWAPEVEVAFLDNWALEAEVGFEGSELIALKLGLQGTLLVHGEGNRTGHGVQLLLEYEPHHSDLVVTPLYILGHRFSPRWSVLAMLAPSLQIPLGSDGTITGPDDDPGYPVESPDITQVSLGLVANGTLFYDLAGSWVLGLEENLQWFDGALHLRVMPQLHWEISEHLSWQLGVGMVYAYLRTSVQADFLAAELATRLVVVF